MTVGAGLFVGFSRAWSFTLVVAISVDVSVSVTAAWWLDAVVSSVALSVAVTNGNKKCF